MSNPGSWAVRAEHAPAAPGFDHSAGLLPTTAVTVHALLAALIGFAAGWALVRGLARRVRHRRWAAGAALVTVLAPPTVERDGAAALWRHLAGLQRPRWRRMLCGQPHLCFEYHMTAAGSTIRMWVPGPIPAGLVQRALTAAWPGATTRTAPAPQPAIDPDAGRAVSSGGVLRLARAGGLPIRQDVSGDPVAALLAAPGELHTSRRFRPAGGDQVGDRVGDEVIVQVLVRPVTATRAAHDRHDVAGRLVGAVGAIAVWGAREVLTLITPGPLTAADPAGRGPRRPATAMSVDHRTRLEHAGQDRAAVAKARDARFETLIRYAATTHIRHPPANPDPETARREGERARRVVRGRADAVATVFASYSGHNFYRRHRLRHPARAVAARRFTRGDLLSVGELAAIATLPLAEHTPGLIRAGARNVAPPPGIPTPGPGVKPLGDTTTDTTTGTTTDTTTDTTESVTDNTTGHGGRCRSGRPVGVRVTDARHHLHVIGATGSGKSTLLAGLILDDIAQRRGVVVIDPKGDLITDLLARLPAPARARAMVIDPDQTGPPPCLNPLAPPSRYGAPTEHARGSAGPGGEVVVENLVSIFRRVFAAYWGPRTDDLMRAACLTLHAQPGPRSLADLPALLADPLVRARHLRAVQDPLLRGFWDSYERMSDPARAQLVAPLMNKIRALLLRPFTRTLLTEPHRPPRPADPAGKAKPAGPRRSVVDMGAALDGGIVLARLPKGSLGDEGTRLIGSIVVAQVWAAATARATLPADQRRDAALVIDECHNFLNLPHGIADILAEARGLRLSLTLAHQNLAQLPRDLREGIATNARNKIFFTVGPDDARDLARHTLPQLGEHDLAHLDAFHAAARLVHHNTAIPAFTLHTRPLPTPQPRRRRPTRDPAGG